MKYFLYSATILLISFSLISSQQGFDLVKSIERGKQIYNTQCFTCHMEKGEGIQGVYPPLAKSDYLMADKTRAIKQVLEGANGEMVVNGEKYFGFMTGFPLSDTEVSDVLNYIRNSWGNKGEPVKPSEVKAQR
ncbi:MAG: cytochrome c [Cyclobacteriaceae bacterium]|nr:cytochrome c [Cyclobacteriaceae bacterium]